MVGESGIFVPDDVAYVQSVSTHTMAVTFNQSFFYLWRPDQLCDVIAQAGVGAILVGESLVKQGDPAAGIKTLLSLP